MEIPTKCILLVEDNPSDVALTQRALRKARIGNEIIVAENGQIALDYLFGSSAHDGMVKSGLPTVILLDLNLPKVPGLEVLRRIREDPRTHRQPVVILSTSNEPDDVSAGYDLGVNSYITKPVNFTQFAQVVEQLGLYWLLLNELPPARRGSSETRQSAAV